jgi:hypothetical protein
MTTTVQPRHVKLAFAGREKNWVFAAYELKQLSDAFDRLSLQWPQPLNTATTGGAMIPTTTIMTKNRVYVPVPAVLELAFQITAGAKEFYVRFDTIRSGIGPPSIGRFFVAPEYVIMSSHEGPRVKQFSPVTPLPPGLWLASSLDLGRELGWRPFFLRRPVST